METAGLHRIALALAFEALRTLEAVAIAFETRRRRLGLSDVPAGNVMNLLRRRLGHDPGLEVAECLKAHPLAPDVIRGKCSFCPHHGSGTILLIVRTRVIEVCAVPRGDGVAPRLRPVLLALLLLPGHLAGVVCPLLQKLLQLVHRDITSVLLVDGGPFALELGHVPLAQQGGRRRRVQGCQRRACRLPGRIGGALEAGLQAGEPNRCHHLVSATPALVQPLCFNHRCDRITKPRLRRSRRRTPRWTPRKHRVQPLVIRDGGFALASAGGHRRRLFGASRRRLSCIPRCNCR
mmetsp:Transcript_3722/g.8506  ORF Transcript_3722/g.8506 Transcript_3722/m.8506 type:complete len:292 (+) Transcript_3722:555-1430(+)